jgi:hypothetical protein
MDDPLDRNTKTTELRLGAPERARPALPRGLVVAGALVGTVLALYLALALGAWGFDFRRASQHDGRLRRLLQQAPTLDRVERGLAAEGSPLVDSPPTPGELEESARRLGGAKAGEVLEKGRRWPITRVFLAGDMVYFLYFDADGVMRDYTWVSR